MTPGIFVVREDGQLIEMEEAPYEGEAILQELLERYPNLLSGEPVAPGIRRFLLLRREAGIPAAEGASDRFSLDHLFIDGEGVPTFVEVKLRSDTRIRREVIGQMLEYAANASTYWGEDRMREYFEETCRARGVEASEVLSDFLVEGREENEFWELVATNFRAGRIRLVFVADTIPVELQRLVEFLNEELRSSEVIALEVKRYSQDGVVTLVATPVGKTATARRKESAGPRHWDEQSFLTEIAEQLDSKASAVAARLLEWAKPRMHVRWGTGQQTGSFVLETTVGDRRFGPLQLNTDGKVYVRFAELAKQPQFAPDEQRRELLRRINSIPRVQLADDAINRTWPHFSVLLLTEDDAFGTLTAALEWYLSVSENT